MKWSYNSMTSCFKTELKIWNCIKPWKMVTFPILKDMRIQDPSWLISLPTKFVNSWSPNSSIIPVMTIFVMGSKGRKLTKMTVKETSLKMSQKWWMMYLNVTKLITTLKRYTPSDTNKGLPALWAKTTCRSQRTILCLSHIKWRILLVKAPLPRMLEWLT